MVTKGNRQNGEPIIIAGETTEKLSRIAVEEKVFNEDWLQRFIYSNPNLLPIDQLDSSFSPLIPLGREIATKVGFIDNLYISPSGYITLVETKLWRNSEARREVVGQIIDYAKELNKWTFEDLNKSIVAFNQLYNNNKEGILDTFRKYESLDSDGERDLIDNISKNLKRGRLLLLIVGDGIRESVEEMVDYLSLSPQLQFTLALIELQVYKFKDNKTRLVIPQIVTRTREITRGIIKIENNATENINISVEPGEILDKRTDNISSRFKITAEDFFTQLEQNTNKQTAEFAKTIIADSEANNWQIEWNTGSFGVRLIDPIGSGVKISLFNVDRSGLIYPGFSKGAFDKLGLPPEISHQYASNTAKLFPGLSPHNVKGHLWDKYQPLQSLIPVYDEFLTLVKQYTKQIVNFREQQAE